MSAPGPEPHPHAVPRANDWPRRLARQFGPGLGLALVVAIGLSAFSPRLQGGVQTAGRAVVRDLATQPPTPSVGACANLDPGLRSGLAPVAFVLDGALRSVSLGGCHARTLVGGGVQGPIRYSADGHWLGYGAGTAIAAGGGDIERPLGGAVLTAPGAWAWSPQGDTMAGITRAGAIMVGAPGRLPERLEPPDWGASQVMFAGSRTLVAVRGAAIWTIPLEGGAAHVVYTAPYRRAEVRLALARPGEVVFWQLPYVSATAGATGVPLAMVALSGGAVTALASAVAIAPENVVACGRGIAAVTGLGSNLTRDRQVVVYSAAGRPRVLGQGIAPSCSADGRVIAFAHGPIQAGAVGDERRRIWVVTAGGRPQPLSTAPPSGVSNESPSVSPDGRAVTWIRTTGPAGGAAGNPNPYVGQVRVAPVSGPVQPGTPITSVGSTQDVSGRLGWPDSVTVGTPAATGRAGQGSTHEP